MSHPIKVTHLITGLGTGGAEMMLLRLLSKTDRARFQPEVISMMDVGGTAPQIEELGIRVRSLGMQRAHPNPFALLKLAAWLRADRPHVLATWMYHANFLGSLAAPLAGGMPVAWGLHHDRLNPAILRRRTIWIAKTCGPLSHRLVSSVICCSECTRREHVAIGYDASKMVVIQNGFDLDLFRPDVEARHAIRMELGIPEDTPVICLAGRYHPQKDHGNFIRAAALIHDRLPTARFVLCGHEITWQNDQLSSQIDAAGLRNSFHLLGVRNDTWRIFNASDIVCCSSIGEAFSLVIGEAMGCGIPCVATDVGDSAVLVGDAGTMVPPANSAALADACSTLLELPRESRIALGRRARARIVENFELSRVVDRYQALYERLAEADLKDRSPFHLRSKSEVLQ